MMKFSLVIISLAIAFTGFSQTYDVLFIGNSYTYSNNLPEMLRDLALSNGDTVNYDSNTPGGYTFELHSTNATTAAKIEQKKWDYVVLQEQSQRPSFPPLQVAVEVYPFAAKLDSMIKDSGPCTKTVFFMTWGRKYGDQINCPLWPPVCTYAGMQQRLRESYMKMGDTLSATVAPVGIAWKNSIEADSMVNLFSGDNSHPSVIGSYLTACVFYATLFQESPVGLTYISTLNQATALFLQNIAAQTVLDSLSNWNINANLPDADFLYSVNNSTVSFTNTSVNADNYNWDFGDGSFDIIPNPVHDYASPGKYIVNLNASTTCASNTKIDTIEIITTGIDDTYQDKRIMIYPNPAEDVLNIYFTEDLSDKVKISFINIDGKTIFNEIISDFSSKKKISLAVDHLLAGTYLLMIRSNNINFTERVIIGN